MVCEALYFKFFISAPPIACAIIVSVHVRHTFTLLFGTGLTRAGADGPKRKHRKEKDENQQPVAPMRASRRMAGIAAELPAGISMGMEQEKRLEARRPSLTRPAPVTSQHHSNTCLSSTLKYQTLLSISSPCTA